MTIRRLTEPYDAEYERNAYDADYYKNHTKYYEKAIPNFATFMNDNFKFESIADIGCGTGAFVHPFEDTKKVLGFDFSVGSKAENVLKKKNYISTDISKEGATEAAKDFDIAMSLETYEHIFPEFEKVYLSNIFGLNPKFVILSCAEPGQIGRRHVNCKTKSDVIKIVKKLYPNYKVRKDLMEKFSKIKYLASFYRKNTLILQRHDK